MLSQISQINPTVLNPFALSYLTLASASAWAFCCIKARPTLTLKHEPKCEVESWSLFSFSFTTLAVVVLHFTLPSTVDSPIVMIPLNRSPHAKQGKLTKKRWDSIPYNHVVEKREKIHISTFILKLCIWRIARSNTFSLTPCLVLFFIRLSSYRQHPYSA